WGLRTLSQRVSRASRSDSPSADSARPSTTSARNRPPGEKTSSTGSSGFAMQPVLVLRQRGPLWIMVRLCLPGKRRPLVTILHQAGSISTTTAGTSSLLFGQDLMASAATLLMNSNLLVTLGTAAETAFARVFATRPGTHTDLLYKDGSSLSRRIIDV